MKPCFGPLGPLDEPHPFYVAPLQMKPSFPPEPDLKPSGDPIIRPPRKIGMGIALFFGLFLSACATPTPSLVVHKNVVYVPPASLFNCPLTPLPQAFSSNQQVAQTLNSTYGNNVVCHNNMNALQNDLNNQKKVFSR